MSSNKYFKDWYEKNKERLSEKRKKLYKSDPDYRQTQVNRSRSNRAARKVIDTRPAEYIFDTKQLTEYLGVTSFTLGSWRKKGYYPQPASFSGKFFFTQKQADQLKKLADFMQMYEFRVPEAKKPDLEVVTTLISLNWS